MAEGPITGGGATGQGDVGVDMRRFDHDRWERLRRDQMGVDAVDPLGHRIGMSAAGRYRPIDGEKHVIVGEFDHYGWYNPFFSGDEADFNIHVAPDPPFAFLLEDVRKVIGDRELQKRQRGQGFCVECEITPDEGFYDNEFFPTDDPLDSPLVGRKIGAYGPWVGDHGHRGRPEIHPCEILWWEAPSRPGIRFTRYFLVLQDDSNRFDRAKDYDGPVPRPWSAFPRRADLTIALQPVLGRKNSYDLRILRSREIADMPTPGSATQQQSTGRTVVDFRKLTAHPQQVAAHLGRPVPDPDGEHLRCFLHLGVQVGAGNRGREGYALLRLETRVS